MNLNEMVLRQTHNKIKFQFLFLEAKMLSGLMFDLISNK